MVIRAGRDVMGLDEAAHAAGMDPQAMRRRLHRRGLAPVNAPPHSLVGNRRPRPALWDADQVRAELADDPIPNIPAVDAAADLLDRVEAANLLGLELESFDRARHEGRITLTPELCSDHQVPHWQRRSLNAVVQESANDPARGGGRPAGTEESKRDRVLTALRHIRETEEREPNQAELVRATGVSRMTVRAALADVQD
ncbi:hypothetical protein FHX42_005171 [Saccharopolyspora lacisalsi]|uniref:Uncharacterized protein n=1 Tax=Halosaccharopolyspora lacisalsi TaxID=1000566 RepID=A0A839E1Q4_9PSEU|nr:hypothetical protein [Halosaccharopolyspora lacisalsi]MBA8827764.1 hypothetical protein [Halosaccharopolyspora lacisalsi]